LPTSDNSLITAPETGFIDEFGFLRAVELFFVWKVGFDAACVLKYDLEVDKRDLGCVPLG